VIYLADFLLEKGMRCTGSFAAPAHLTPHASIIFTPIPTSRGPNVSALRGPERLGELVKLLYELKPDRFIISARQSHVRVSFDIPEYTSDVTGVGNNPIWKPSAKWIAFTFLSSIEQ